MKIPHYWARARYDGKDPQGRDWEFTGVGWSFDSLQEAKSLALIRAKRIFDRFAGGEIPDRYDYRDTPIREEILEEVCSRGAVIAVITRNRYGATVLNCAQALFVDIDFPPQRPVGFLEGILLAFNRQKRLAQNRERGKSAIEGVEQWAAAHPGCGLRIYRTREGLRVLFTDRLYDPQSRKTAAIFAELGADPLYVKLTGKQECFRARLSAKPWRCGASRPPVAFPREDERSEAAFQRWLAGYRKRDARFKVCELVKEIGPSTPHDELRVIMEIHDRETGVGRDAELA